MMFDHLKSFVLRIFKWHSGFKTDRLGKKMNGKRRFKGRSDMMCTPTLAQIEKNHRNRCMKDHQSDES